MKTDKQGRITIPIEIRPKGGYTDGKLAAIYCSDENAIGIIPLEKLSESDKFMGVIVPETQGRICITKYLSAIHAKKGEDLTIYTYRGVIYICKP